MEELFSIQTYGVLGYSMAMALALACASVGIAYFRAGRDKLKAALFTASAFLFAAQFAYLVVVSVEPTWLDRTVTQPYVRTVAFLGASCGWGYLYLMLRKEARENGTSERRASQSNRSMEIN